MNRHAQEPSGTIWRDLVAVRICFEGTRNARASMSFGF